MSATWKTCARSAGGTTFWPPRRGARLATSFFFDTDAVMTAVWADVLLGERPDDLDRIDDPADLYLLCDIDVPFVADGIRYFPDQATRAKMFAQTRAELERRRLPFVTITGSRFMRLRMAVDAIQARFPEIKAP